jgi:transposase
MLHLSASCNYYFCNVPTDMRKGFDSLSGMVSQHMQLNVLTGSIFIFINKKRNQVKLLLWEGDGFALYYKRLEQGTYEMPTLRNDNLQVTYQQLQFILQGIQLKSVKMKKRYQPMSVNKAV